jgi:hypothetical protein
VKRVLYSKRLVFFVVYWLFENCACSNTVSLWPLDP